MSSWEDNILREPIARSSGAVLSLPVEGTHRHFKTRFLAEDVEGIWMEAPPAGEQQLVEATIAQKAEVAVAFKTQLSKFTFTSTIQIAHPNYATSEGTRIGAILLLYPSEIRSVQLRAHLRVNVPEDHEMAFRVWRMMQRVALLDTPSTHMELAVKVGNISLGGIGLQVLPVRGKSPSLMARDRLRLLLAYREIAILIEGELVYMQTNNDGVVDVGIEFAKGETGVGSEAKLAKLKEIVVAMHRLGNPGQVDAPKPTPTPGH